MRATAPWAVRPGLTGVLGLTLSLWVANAVVRLMQGHHGLASHLVLTVPALYFLCICVHDGVHGVLHRHKRTNDVAATLLAGVVGLPFPLLRSTHLQHHRRFGTEDDPERVIYSASLWQLPFRLPLVPFFYLRGLRALSRLELIVTAVHVVTLALVLATGGTPLLLGWALPALMAIVWFGFTTVYVPHSRYAPRLMPWLQAHSGWHFDHHKDLRYPFPQYAQLRAWHLDNGASPSSPLEGRILRLLAKRVC